MLHHSLFKCVTYCHRLQQFQKMPPKKVATKSGVTPKKQTSRPTNKGPTSTKTVNKQPGNNYTFIHYFVL